MGSQLIVETAQREKLKIPILLSGASGSGKTLSALLIAYGIVESMFPDEEKENVWKKIGVIDTEHRRSLLYVDSSPTDQYIGKFQYVDLKAPYSVDRYEEAFWLLINAGCEVIILDSISHEWEGVGGMLDEVDRLGGRFGDWKTVKPLEKRFLDLIINDSVHVISTARTKQDYIVEPNEKGKMAPRKVGLKVIQKDQLEYEFAVTFRIEQDALAYAMKDNSNIFKEPRQLSSEDGRKLYEWSEIGVDVAKQERERRDSEERQRLAMINWINNQQDQTTQQIVMQAISFVRLQLDAWDYVSVLNLYKQIKGANNNGNI